MEWEIVWLKVEETYGLCEMGVTRGSWTSWKAVVVATTTLKYGKGVGKNRLALDEWTTVVERIDKCNLLIRGGNNLGRSAAR